MLVIRSNHRRFLKSAEWVLVIRSNHRTLPNHTAEWVLVIRSNHKTPPHHSAEWVLVVRSNHKTPPHHSPYHFSGVGVSDSLKSQTFHYHSTEWV